MRGESVKKMKNLFILMLIISIMATACTNTLENTGSEETDISKEEAIKVSQVADTEDVEDETEEKTQESLRKTRPEIVDPFLANFPPDFTGGDLGIYIRDNIANASKAEADKMIEWLIIYQEKVQSDFNANIWEDEYMNVLNNHMEGSLDKSKLASIENESVRNDYIELVNSFLTIENYYEHPVVETDWLALMEYSQYVSDDLRQIIDLNKKFYYYEYDREEVDVDGLAEDIIILEEIAKNNKSTFIKWQANYLCRSLIYDLLLGPENVYLFHYDGKDSKEYHSIMALTDKYPDSKLKEIIEGLDRINQDDIWGAIDIIKEKFDFGLACDNYIKVNEIESQNGQYELVQIYMPSKIEKQDEINNIISLDTEEFIESLAGDKTFNLYIHGGTVSFQNDRYISYGGTLETIDSNGNEDSYFLRRTLDYIKGKYITLEEYFDSDFIFIQEYIERLRGVKIESLPEFQLTNWGIEFYINQGAHMAEWSFISIIELLDYFTLDEVLNKDY